LLAGDAVLEPLLNDSVPIDRDFMGKVDSYAQALNSSAHSFEGEFGADDINAVQRDAMVLLMARRGVDKTHHADMLNRAVARFGPLSSDLASLNLAVQKGQGGTAGMGFLPAGMTALRALEGPVKLLMNMLPRAQLSQMGAASRQEPAPGDEKALRRDNELRAQFMEKRFEGNSPIPALSDNVRAFAESHGLSLPPADETARQAAGARSAGALHDANLKVASMFENGPEFQALIPGSGTAREKITPAFRELFRQAALRADLSGLDVEQLNPQSFFAPLSGAAHTLATTAAAEGRTVDRAAMLDTVLSSFTENLAALKGFLDSIDALPERRSSDPIAPGQFTAREKTILKEVAQRHDLRDLNALTVLMNRVVDSSSVGCMRNLAAPNATPRQLAENIKSLVSHYLDADKAIGKNKPKGYEDALRVMIDMTLRLGGISREQAAVISENLNSAAAQTVAGAFNLVFSEFPVPPNRQPPLLAMSAMMNAVRMEADAQSQVDPMFFSDTLNHVREVPGGHNGCMNVLADMAGSAISASVRALSSHTPPYSLEERNILLPIAEKISQSGGNAPLAGTLDLWVNAAGRDLLAAQRANNGKPLTNAQIWQSITGFPMPRGVSGANFGARMVAEVSARYRQAILAAVPDTPEHEIESNLTTGVFLQISPKRLLELARPGAALTLAELSGDTHMSSLVDYGPDTAYGLCTDFRRRDPGTVMTFENAAGDGFVIQPFHIPDNENNPEHPVFQRIINTVRDMSVSEAQTARILQAFSQAGVIDAHAFSAAFPGVPFSEHGNFSVTAKQREDGAVVVDIASDPALPLTFKKQYIIATDGSHECTAFEMRRA
ncbi:MAG: hypothetical protein LBS89_02085, partial [Zoogloeaceae bacterium]|nr:hypothetical protein [Zoogloeaceae bacterium]